MKKICERCGMQSSYVEKCGKSTKCPYCDGTIKFKGKEVKVKEPLGKVYRGGVI